MVYVLQAFAALFMFGAATLMVLWLRRGNYKMAAFNLFLFAVNAGLFYWQGTMGGIHL